MTNTVAVGAVAPGENAEPESTDHFTACDMATAAAQGFRDGVASVRPVPPAAAVVILDQYDAGLLNDFGGGNVDWWQDYIRAELDRAHDFYQSQLLAPVEQGSMVLPEGWLKALDEAVTAIYFDDGSDFRPALLAVVRNLSPGIADELDRNGTAAWHMVRDMLAAAPTPEPPPPAQDAACNCADGRCGTKPAAPEQPAPLTDEIPDFTAGSGNKAKRRIEALAALSPEQPAKEQDQ